MKGIFFTAREATASKEYARRCSDKRKIERPKETSISGGDELDKNGLVLSWFVFTRWLLLAVVYVRGEEEPGISHRVWPRLVLYNLHKP